MTKRLLAATLVAVVIFGIGLAHYIIVTTARTTPPAAVPSPWPTVVPWNGNATVPAATAPPPLCAVIGDVPGCIPPVMGTP
jgi:hypothetical protein